MNNSTSKTQSQPRKPQIACEVNPELVGELKEISKRIQIPQAQIIREGIAEKLLNLKRTHPRLISDPELINA